MLQLLCIQNFVTRYRIGWRYTTHSGVTAGYLLVKTGFRHTMDNGLNAGHRLVNMGYR
jgi:hypothetical protein